jgi:hypothetical protein
MCHQLSSTQELLNRELAQSNCNISKLREYERRLETLKRHNCSSNFLFDLENDDEFLTEHYSSSHTGVNKHYLIKERKMKDFKDNMYKVTPAEYSRRQNKRTFNEYSQQTKPIKSRYDLGINKVSNKKLQEKITKFKENFNRSQNMTINKQSSREEIKHHEKSLNKVEEEEFNDNDSAFEDAEDENRQIKSITNLKMIRRSITDIQKHEKTFKISRTHCTRDKRQADSEAQAIEK